MTQPDFLFGVTPGDIIYDIEVFPNIFTLTARHSVSGSKWVFEISTRRNDLGAMCLWLDILKQQQARMVGFNSIGYDYPVIHFILNNRVLGLTNDDIYAKSMSIINTPWNARHSNTIYESEWHVAQLDLFKVHHFDNPSKSTGLKILEFNMRRDNVENMPFDVGIILTHEQMDILLAYNDEDVLATLDFYERSKPDVNLREGLTRSFGLNFMNMSTVKIGETLLVKEMEKHGVNCYTYEGSRKVKKQTIRESLALAEVIFPYIAFERPEFQRIHKWLSEQTIRETKGVFSDLKASIEGIDYKLGTGGLHASVSSRIVRSSETHQLVDVDVAGFYPDLAIKNGIYPEHLGPEFCGAMGSVVATRRTFPKKTPENEAYKLAGNGAYGGSNNKYSPFFDMKYTMATTINGQLLLCMLIEQMLKVPGLTMIQCNTDGITYLCPREYLEHTKSICRWWEGVTKLTLEEALYSRMFIRDVNNYIAEYEGGRLKRIGAYAYTTATEDPGTRELPHHKDWSSRISAMAAEAYLVHGTPVREFIENHEDVYDFLLRTKVPKASILEHGGKVVPNIIRYYVSTNGDFLEKVSPPKGIAGHFKKGMKCSDELYAATDNSVWNEGVHTKNRSVHDTGRTGIHTGWTVKICNRMAGHNFSDINYQYYITEAEKLSHCMQ